MKFERYLSKYFQLSPRIFTNASDSYYPFVFLNGILGLLVLEMPSGVPWHKLSYAIVIVRSAAYCFLFRHFDTSYNKKIYERDLSFIVDSALYVNLATAIFMSMLGTVTYKKVKDTLDRITMIDETLEMFGIDPEYALEYKRNRLIIIIFCLGCFCKDGYIISSKFYFHGNLSNSIISIAGLELPIIFNWFVELTFATQILLLGKRFERLNALIVNLTAISTQAFVSKNFDKYQRILEKRRICSFMTYKQCYKNRNNANLVLKMTRQLHLNLCEISRDVNDAYGKQMALQLATTFITLTGVTFGFYAFIGYPKEGYKSLAYHGVLFTLHLTFHIVKMIYIIRTIVSTATEARETCRIAREMYMERYNNGLDKGLINEIQQFSLQILQNPLGFTASGLISLDFNYVQGVVIAVTTYTMILIQSYLSN